MPGTFSPAADFKRKLLVSDPGMHHGTCVTHVPWCMSGSLTCGDGENVPGIPGACAPAILRIWQEAHYLNQWWYTSSVKQCGVYRAWFKNFDEKCNNFHSKTLIWKFGMQIGGHFVPPSMCFESRHSRTPLYKGHACKIFPVNAPLLEHLGAIECTCSTSHNAPFRTEMCTFLLWMVHCGMRNRCILCFVRLVYRGSFVSSTYDLCTPMELRCLAHLYGIFHYDFIWSFILNHAIYVMDKISYDFCETRAEFNMKHHMKFLPTTFNAWFHTKLCMGFHIKFQ